MPQNDNRQEQEYEEEKKKKNKKLEELDFEEELANAVFGDRAKAGQMQSFAFYFDEDQWRMKRLFHNQMSVRTTERENEGALNPAELDKQAAREGRLFIISDRPPYLQKVNVDENGKVSLQVVTKNPVKIPQGLSGFEKRAWENLKTNFEDLTKGNLAKGHGSLVQSWRNRWARKKAQQIQELTESARKKSLKQMEKENRQMEEQNQSKANTRMVRLDEMENEEEEVLEEEEVREEEVREPEEAHEEQAHNEAEVHNEPEAHNEPVPEPSEVNENHEEIKAEPVQGEQKENIEAEKQEESVKEQAESFIKEGNHQEAAATVAQELQNLSGKFEESKYMDDNAVKTGTEMRELMEHLERTGSVEAMDALEKNPEFKENKNVYQGQENLAEMGQLGKEGREMLKTQPQDQQVEKEALLNIMVGEYANSVLVRKSLGKDVSEEMKKIGEQPNAEKIIDKLKTSIEGTNVVKNLMEGKKEQLNAIFSDGIESQKEYTKAISEVKEQTGKKKNEENELQRENEKDYKKENDARVLSNQDKRKTGPSMGGM